VAVDRSSTFGDLLRWLRRAKGLTQEELAERAGLSLRGISDLERGLKLHPHRETITLLARALDLGEDDRARLTEAGRAPLKVASSVAVHGVGGNAVSDLAPVESPRHNLPFQLTSFIGRERELTAVRERLQERRLVTLTGTGGSGKTRLALEAAADLLDNFADGVWLVELAPVARAEHVPQMVATVLGVEEKRDRSYLAALCAYLQRRSPLLVLDNCEHLIEACAALVDALLHACPTLTILTTSREPLHVPGEVIYPIKPLSTPTESLVSAASVLDYEAPQLFVTRARAASPSFVVTDDNAPAIAQICIRLDGIPLALELAAPRVRGLAAEELAARLEHRFRLLVYGFRVAPPRHQTLRALLDWSYGLLTGPEQRIFRRLALFTGGFSLEAAEVICADDELDADLIVDLLLRLVDKSLVVADEDSAGTRRYRLLETMRQYAMERLAAPGEERAVAQRHAAYFLQRAEEADAGIKSPQFATWYAWLVREQENLRSALRWLIEDRQAESALRLSVALGWFWYVRGYLSEARASFETVLSLPETATRTVLRSRVCFLAGVVAWSLGDYPKAASLADDALAIGRELGASQQIGQALNVQAGLKSDHGDYAAARALLVESLEVYQDIEDDWSRSLALYWLGVVSWEEGDVDQARALHDQALELRRKMGDRWGVGTSLGRLAEISAQLGDHLATRAFADEALAIARQLGNRRGVARNLWYLATAALGQGDHATGADLYWASLTAWQDIGERGFIPRALEGIAGVVAARGSATVALCLAGAAAKLREDLGTVSVPVERTQISLWLESARRTLGARDADKAWERGRRMTMEAAVDLGQSTLSTVKPADSVWQAKTTPQPREPVALTARECEVVSLIARGFTNRQIADVLVVSERTVEVHIAHIRAKLGLASRTRIATWAVEQGLLAANSD